MSFSGLKIEAGSVSGTEDGGAIKIRAGANTPEVFLSDAWLTGNDASGATSYGGAIRNDANLTIVNSLIDGNTVAEGGGVFNESGANLTMVNVTLSGNDAQNGDGGGLFNAGNATLRHVTIADNTATNEGGGVRDDLAGAVTDVANSIIAGNTAGSGSNDFFGAIASSSSNIIGDDTGASGSFDASDQRNVDPLLGSLANNGGALMTHAPAAAEAIGTADDALASDFDQNGLLRDGAPDIGAHEVGAATALPELTLHISTKDPVVAGGQPGTDTWQEEDLIAIGDPQLNLGPATTSGTFSEAFDLDGLAPGTNTTGAHLVGRNIDAGGFQLLAGDLLLTPGTAGTYTSNNTTPLDGGFVASVSASNEDLVVFRPDTPGDYTTGGFALLIENMTGDNSKVRGVTLVEQTTVVGGTTLQAGDFLYSRAGVTEENDIYIYETGTAGAGGAPDARVVLLAGDDAQVGIQEKIHGIELLEEAASIGGQSYDAGTLLVNVRNPETVGANGLAVDDSDVFALDVAQSTESGGVGIVNASMLFDGSDVAFDTSSEELDAIMLAPTAGVVSGHYLDRLDAVEFTGDHGTLSWTNGWQEVGEADGADSGSIRVLDSFDDAALELRIQSDGSGVWREADLSGAGSATLSFDFARTGMDAGDAVVVYVQSGGGTGGTAITGAPGTWDELVRFEGPAADGAYQGGSYDISSYIATDTRILFVAEDMNSGGDEFFIDNIRIDLASASVLSGNAAPIADASASAPHTIAEGGTLNLDGSASTDSDGTITTYEWDIGNDGSFEKTGVATSFSWAELDPAGIKDDGTYDVALRVTDDSGAQHSDVFTLTVSNTAPTLTLTGAATADAGSVYTLDLMASDPGDDTISTDTINWGDGTVTTETFDGPVTTVSHTYTDAGFTRSITYSVEDEDGTSTSSDLIVGTWIAGTDEIYRFDGNTGSFEALFGSSAGTIDRPYAPVLGPDGNYYVGGYNSDNIVRYDADGNYLGEFVSAGILAPGIELDLPGDGMAWGPDGNLYVANYNDDNILRFDAAGNFIDEFGVAGGIMDGPGGMAFGPDGDLYVSSWPNHKIVKFDGASGGSPTVVLDTGLNNPGQLLFDDAGNLYIANAGLNEVSVWDGATLSSYFTDPSLDRPTGITFGPDGSLYVSSYYNDRVLSYDGTTTKTFVPDSEGGLDKPGHLLFTPAHQVLVNSAVNNAPVFINSGPFTVDENAVVGTVVGDIDASDGDGADPGLGDLIFSEIMYNPASAEPSWEWVELYNRGSEAVDLTGFVFDDNNTLVLGGANIASGTINAGETAVLYNADSVAAGNFTAAWGSGANLIAVSEWDDILLANAGDTLSLWESFADYSGDHQTHANAFMTLTYDDNAPWPVEDGFGSIYLTDLDADPNDGSNWALSTVGSASPLGGTAYQSTAAAGNSGLDVGTPGDPGPGGGVTYSIISNENPDAGGQLAFSIDTDTGVITVNDADDLDFEGINPLTITVQADDGVKQSTTVVTINLKDLNEQLGASNVDQTQTYTEGDASVALDDIVVIDVDTGETVTATLTLADINAGSLSTSGAATYTASTGVWTITDTIANVNAALANVAFLPATDYDQDTTIAVNIADGGEDGTAAVTGTINLDVTPENDAPTINALAGYGVDEDDNYRGLGGISIGDVDAGGADLRVTLAVDDGLLQIGNPAGLTSISGNQSATVVLEGSVTVINGALATLSYKPDPDFWGADNLSITVDDLGNTGGAPEVTNTNVPVTVNSVNDQPGATSVNQTKVYTEGDAAVALDDIVVSDVDTGETVTATLTLADINAGSLSTSGTATYTAGMGVWTITDTVANVNTALANVAFVPATQYDQDTTIAVNIADGGEDGTVAITGIINLDVTPVNDQLGAITVNQTKTYTEGDALVALDDIVVSDVDMGEIVTATLTLADVNAGSLTTSGTATYTAGTGVWTITDTVADVNTALANVAFAPAGEYDQDTTIAVNIADGGEDGTVAVTGTINLDVTPVNDQPGATVVNQTQMYTEGDVSVALDDIVATDVDSAETITATLTLADINAGSLTTSGTATYTAGTGIWTLTDTVANVNAALANIAFNPAAEYDQDTTIAVNIADGGEDGTVAVTGTINLDVTPVNDQPGATVVNQTQAYTEGDASVALDDIVVTDVDSAETITATLTLADINAGSLTTSGTATYTAGTGIWTLTDTVANVNAALANVAFMPATEYDQDTTIAVNIADGGEDGTVAVTGTINLDVTPVNDQPGATVVNQTQVYTEGDVSVALDDIAVSDADVGEIVTATLTLADTSAGSLTTSGTATYTAGTGIWTLTDTVANVNAALANVAFMPATEYDQDTTIAVNIADGGEDGTVAVTGTINLDVTPVNDQPGATVVNQTQVYTEGDVSVALDDIAVSDADVGEIVTATLTLADTSAGSLTTSGTATYTAGTGIWTLTDTVANVNAALANVAFMPATEYDQDTSISVNIADGGEDGTVAVTGTINLDVTPVGCDAGQPDAGLYRGGCLGGGDCFCRINVGHDDVVQRHVDTRRH